ncbi:MAG: hypothetical protein GX548_13290 [Lentisphaerae bacterium]|nr:hypothetical protein [Lentisphaerota bacterium]
MELNAIPVSRFAATLAAVAGTEPPRQAEPPVDWVVELFGQYCREEFDRVFIFNSDCIAMWLYDKYPEFFEPVLKNTLLALPMRAASPAVTPVNFASLYTGAQPCVHGIQKYEKPVLKTDTLFDSMRRSGKKVALFTLYEVGTMSNIFKQRDIDYYLCNSDSEAEAETRRIIDEDGHDFVCSYGMDYDYIQHRKGPESAAALTALQQQTARFGRLADHIRKVWAHHNTLVVFATDHGVHAVGDGRCAGDHGEDIPEDLNIMHFWGAVKRTR